MVNDDESYSLKKMWQIHKKQALQDELYIQRHKLFRYLRKLGLYGSGFGLTTFILSYLALTFWNSIFLIPAALLSIFLFLIWFDCLCEVMTLSNKVFSTFKYIRKTESQLHL